MSRSTEGGPTSRSAQEPHNADDVPAGFTVALAAVDAVPVLLFCASMAVVAVRFASPLFMAGAACSVLAGVGKVAWKLALACLRRDVAWLSAQFKYLMSAGFLLMLAAVAVAAASGTLTAAGLWHAVSTPPAAVFFALAACGLVALGVMGAALDKRSPRANWAEQLVNACSQAMLLVAVCLA